MIEHCQKANIEMLLTRYARRRPYALSKTMRLILSKMVSKLTLNLKYSYPASDYIEVEFGDCC